MAIATLARLLVEEGKRGCCEERRTEDVVVGEARQNRERVTALGPTWPLAWCAAIALVGYLWSQAAFRRGAR